MRNANVVVVLLFPVLANPTPAAGGDASPFKPEINAYLDCVNTEVVRQQERARHKIDDAAAVIQACSAERSRLLVASGNASNVKKLISGIEAHLRMRERAVDEPKE